MFVTHVMKFKGCTFISWNKILLWRNCHQRAKDKLGDLTKARTTAVLRIKFDFKD